MRYGEIIAGGSDKGDTQMGAGRVSARLSAGRGLPDSSRDEGAAVIYGGGTSGSEKAFLEASANLLNAIWTWL